jgi:NitT/TauT family transport system substrate-binding protein
MTPARLLLPRLALTALLVAGLLPGRAGHAEPLTNVKFSLDWALQGNYAMWSLAIDNGYFAREGLNVTMDRGFGSGDTIIKVASGTYDIGFADINGLVKFDADNPDKPILSFFQLYDTTLASVVTLKSKNIKVPQDLVGKTMGAPEGEGSRVLFPAFARANKLDTSTIKWISVTPQMRETLLIQGQLDAVTGFISTSVINLKAAGVKAEDIVAMPYGEYGLDLPGSGLIAKASYAEANPKVLQGFVRATLAGLRDMLRDPKAAMASLKKRDPLLNDDVELARLQLILDRTMLTPFFKANGFGSVVPERMARAVKVNAEAFGVANPPSPETLYSVKYLPPQSERMP